MSIPTPKDVRNIKVGTPNKVTTPIKPKREFVLAPHLTHKPFAGLKTALKGAAK